MQNYLLFEKKTEQFVSRKKRYLYFQKFSLLLLYTWTKPEIHN